MRGAPLPAALTNRLGERYREPHRHYHTLAHVEALLHWRAHWQTLVQDVHLIDAAIWFHDAVYDTRRRDNEERSAELARVELAPLGWALDDIERVAGLVLATQHHDAGADDAQAWLFLDLDLSVLAQDAHRYAAYSAAVRAEYDWVDDVGYRTGRSAVLRAFLDRGSIYRTPEIRVTWEAAARANLEAELRALSRAA